MFKHILSFAYFDNLSGIHHSNSVRHELDDVNVMGDEQIANIALSLYLPEQIENLGLDGSVKCAGGFIQDNQLWIQD